MDIKVAKNGSMEFLDKSNHIFGKNNIPVCLEIWDGNEENAPERISQIYDSVKAINNKVIGRARIQREKECLELTDEYNITEKEIFVERALRILEGDGKKGVRLWWNMSAFPEKDQNFQKLRYFAPPALFDKNDLDEDGYEDYFHTRKLIYREDRFNYPMFMAYSEEEKRAIRLERYDLPEFDYIPERKIGKNGEKVSVFMQKTDIGSLGVIGDKDNEVYLSCCYPFYEGNATIGLYIIKMVPFGAFWNLEKGEELKVSYRITCDEHKDFHDACWDSVKRVIREQDPQAEELLVSPEELLRLRLKSLNEYYVEQDKAEDINEPAGFVLNCHPQDGKQLENIIQYGFTGQNILNAYNMIRYGYSYQEEEYVRRALKVADFFADKMQMKETGMFYNLYNVDMKKMNFWWTGLLLPLAYAQGDELENLMGPLYEYRKEIIDRLSELEGAYLRCMNEDVTALLRLYLLEKEKGTEHANWFQAVQKYAEFLLNTQESDGGWRRAYDTKGNAITEPEIWFGGTIYEQKSSTATSIPFLTELYHYTKDCRYLKAAVSAGKFVKEYIIEKVRFNGGVHDSIYAKGQLIDNESILYPMFGMLALYEETKDPMFLEGAVKAAHLNSSWVCLWKIPLPKESTLEKYGFNSIGMGACDTCGAGYVHPFQLMCVAEIAQIAVYAKDKELLKTAELYWKGCNQTVSLPQKDWGYASYGLQEEGYLMSWWAVDDPMFSADTGFGYRLKGEGNKTCFPWIPAVAGKGYWSLLDRFGTLDFQKIYNDYFC